MCDENDVAAPAKEEDFGRKVTKLSIFMGRNNLDLAHLAQIIACRMPVDEKLTYTRDDGVVAISHRAPNTPPDERPTRCWTCRWYDDQFGTTGCCRRHAPTQNEWPEVCGDDWCGEYQHDERKA